MKSLSKNVVIQAVVVVFLLAAVVWEYQEMNAAQAEMTATVEDARECRRLAEQIAALQELPQFAALEQESPQQTRDRITAASAQAGLAEASLIRIQPQSPYQLRGTDYRLTPTRLELGNVSLQQITTFAHALVDERRGLTVRDLRIWTNSPDSNASREVWSAEITLTQISYFPTTR